MTHRPVTIMVEAEHLGSQESIEARIATLMAPYSEHMRVEPYVTPCDCIGTEDFDTHDCSECDGSGTLTTTYNPQSRWDYYGPMEDVWDITVDELPDTPTYAILDSENGWQAKGRLGWWGVSTDDQPDWPETFRRVYEANLAAGHQPFLRDYHI